MSSAYLDTSVPEVPKTQKFINLYTYKNDLILDPFLGSGTTAIAAKLLERNFVGYEIEEEYIQIAKNRLKKEVN